MKKCEDCIWFEDYEFEGEFVWRGCLKLKNAEPENCEFFVPAPLPLYNDSDE